MGRVVGRAGTTVFRENDECVPRSLRNFLLPSRQPVNTLTAGANGIARARASACLKSSVVEWMGHREKGRLLLSVLFLLDL